MQTILGIDYGEKRVGVARADGAGAMAFADVILENNATLLARVAEMVEREGGKSAVAVVGHSLDFGGKENPIAARAQSFARALQEKTGCKIVFIDETFTSAEARRQFEGEEEGERRTRAPKGRAHVDASAAALILQKYLDMQRNKSD